MICEIISIGTEVVMGSVNNSNTFYISQKITELGLNVYFHTSVDDDKDRLKSVIETAINRADLIITTGGLGPTNDDMTKEIIAETLNLDLKLDLDMEKKIKDMFINTNRSITNNNYKQAYIPEGSKILENKVGTAPGIYIEKNKKKIIMLPGPPFEMEPMFENNIKKIIDEDFNIITKSINMVGIGESALESRLNELNLDTEHTSVLTFAKKGMVEAQIISKGKDNNLLKKEITDIQSLLEKEFEPYIYGYDNIDLEKVIVDLLEEKKLMISLCESITGGMLSSRLTGVAGASKILDRSIVTYSNRAKIEEVNVKQETLDKYGAVSKETAYEMAKGLFEKSNTDISLSITGIAGPGGSTPNKPIGLVYMSIITKDKEKTFKYNFNGNRNLIMERATISALNELRKLVK